MHELSIVEAVLDVVEAQAPKGSVVRSVQVEAGALRGLVPDVMQWVWQVATAETRHAQARLELTLLPWQLSCPDCGRTFTADDMFAECACGCAAALPVGGTELRVLSLDVEQVVVEGTPA